MLEARSHDRIPMVVDRPAASLVRCRRPRLLVAARRTMYYFENAERLTEVSAASAATEWQRDERPPVSGSG
jgi:hypothetical protein